MERQLMAMASLYGPSTAVGAAVILTIPSLVALTNTKPKRQALYQDQDGIATNESQSEAERAGRSAATVSQVIAGLGLVASVLKTQASPILRDNNASSNWTEVTLWVS